MQTFLLAAYTQANYQLSIHLLDIYTRNPAEGVEVLLERYDKTDDSWTHVAKKRQNQLSDE